MGQSPVVSAGTPTSTVGPSPPRPVGPGPAVHRDFTAVHDLVAGLCSLEQHFDAPTPAASSSAPVLAWVSDLLGAISRPAGPIPVMLRQKGKTPVKVDRMAPFLSRYAYRPAAQLLQADFTEGFLIPCSLPQIPPAADNLLLALLHSVVVSEKLAKEVLFGRMCGPCSSPLLGQFVVSPLGVVPKKEPNKFCLIHHLLFPKGGSVKYAIDPEACAVPYTSFDTAGFWVWHYGKGGLMAKTNIESAFHCCRSTRAVFTSWVVDGWAPFMWIDAFL